MTREDDFSVVVFAKNTSGLYRTYRNIKQNPLADTIQILAVRVEGIADQFSQSDLKELQLLGEKEKTLQAQAMDEKFGPFQMKDKRFREMLKDPKLIYIDGSECQDIASELYSQITGTYITFVRGGNGFSKGAFRELQRCFQEEGSDVAVIKIDGKDSLPVKEHNNYCDSFGKDATLDDHACLLHQMYPAYTFVTEKLKWTKEIRKDTWYLDIMEMVYRNAVSCGKISVISGENARVQIPAEHFIRDEWENLIQDTKQTGMFYERFLKRLEEYRKQGKIRFVKNGDYVLLYYYTKLAEVIFRNPEHVELISYERNIDEFLKHLEFPELIIFSHHIGRENKLYLLHKYFPDINKRYPRQTEAVMNSEQDELNVRIFQLTDEGIHCEFSVVEPWIRNREFCMITGERRYKAVWRYTLDRFGWCRKETATEKLYLVDIPYGGIHDSVCWAEKEQGHIRKMYNVSYGKYTPFAKEVPLFLHVRGMLLLPAGKKRSISSLEEQNEDQIQEQYEICVKPYRIGRTLILGWKRDRALLLQGLPGKKAFFVRWLCAWKRARKKKQIWLFSDRVNRGDDNGEVMFRYVCENPVSGVKPYFVISKNTPESRELVKLGKIVEPFSWNHKILFLLNDLSLSSQANKTVVNPFGSFEYLYRDLMYNKKLVFLQHGVTKDNQSQWLNKYNRNLFGFVVNTKQEYDSIFNYDYYYPAKNVWLTGMPRFDRLVHAERKYVTIMPTWRKSLSSGTDDRGVWKLGEEFVHSEYFCFYNDLLNSEKLLKASEKYGYTICFMPHPNTVDGLHLFRRDPRVKFLDSSSSYREIFAQTDLMVTDYSSVAFDFAYLRKPIVYAQFDRESFFSGSHSYTEGYFDYERDGFGEVEDTLEGTVERIIEYMASDCQIKEKYLKRMEDTFAFNDRNCCRRVYKKIMENM